MNSSFKNIPDISFIDDMTLEELVENMISWYQEKYKEITGREKELSKANPERLKLYTCALVLYQMFQYIDRQAKSNLLKYSFGEYLDNLALGRAERKQGTKATTTFRFTLAAVRDSAVTIPEGTRIGTDGKFFKTVKTAEILPGQMQVDVFAECLEIGVAGNGYLPGEITTLVDPIPYIDSVKNITLTSNGTDIETDDSFAERIFLAPSSFSSAGSEEAYKYFVKTFSADISDVNITSPNLGVVDIRVVLKNGRLPNSEFLESLKTYISDKKIKPITDKVLVNAPELEEYNLDISYFINESDKAIATMIQETVNREIEEYIRWQGGNIGKDINPSELIKRIIMAGAKRVEVRNPIFKKVQSTKLAHCNSKNIIYGGVEDD